MSREDINNKITVDDNPLEYADEQIIKNESAIERELIEENVVDSVTEENYLAAKEKELSVDESELFQTADPLAEETEAEEVVTEPNAAKPFINKYAVIVLLSVLVFSILGLIIWALTGDSKEELAHTDQVVESLFMGPDHHYLNATVTEANFSEATETIRQLSNKNQQNYQEKYDQAKLMYEAINEISSIYEHEGLIIQGDQVPPVDQLLVATSVTTELLDEQFTRFNTSQREQLNEALVSKIVTLYDHARAVIAYTTQAQQTMESLPKSIANRSQLPEVIHAMQVVELNLTEFTNQPKVLELYEELQTYANKVGDIIVAGLEMGEYDSTFWEQVYWTDTLVYYFEGPQPMDEKLISLTFDDGPNEEFTPQLLDILAKHEVKATFFVMGAYVDEYPDIARRIVNEGHIIGNHTYNHPDLSTVSDDEVVKQFIWTQESIQDVTGAWPSLYRMPFGAGGKRVVDLMTDMTSILWNIDSMDWHYHDPVLTYDHIMANLQHNSLLLMHDTHQATPDVIDQLIPVLKEQGYRFVSPTEVGFNLQYYAE